MANRQVDVERTDVEAETSEWLGHLDNLVSDVEGWAKASGWRTRRIEKTVSERPLGKYRVPVLLLEKDAVEVVLNPVARRIPGADGAVDLYRSPAYDDIATLYLEQGRWVVHPGDRPDAAGTGGAVEVAPQACDEQAIRSILDGMFING